MEFLKEYIDAWSSRLRSPIAGSILVSFLVINWKPLYYLLFSEYPAAVRIGFFELNTDSTSLILKPVFFGILLAVGLPWINLVGAVISRLPIRLAKYLIVDEAMKSRIHKLELESHFEDEQAKLKAAKEIGAIEDERRLILAEDVGGKDLKERIILERAASEISINDSKFDLDALINSFSEFDIAVIIEIGAANEGIEKTLLARSSRLSETLRKSEKKPTIARLGSELESSILTLYERKIVSGARFANKITLTSMGFKIFDLLKVQQP